MIDGRVPSKHMLEGGIMVKETISLMEIFFAAYCNEDGGTQIPDCRSCEHNIYSKGCTHPELPLNKTEREVGQ